jgi:adenylate cyclase
MSRAEEIRAWLVEAGLDGLTQSELVEHYCERLVAAGVPLWRASIGADTLHPLIDAQGHRWLQGQGVREEFFERSATPEREAEWRRSPWYWMIEAGGGDVMQRRLDGGANLQFDMFVELAGQGATEYYARLVRFGERAAIGETRGIATSWTTRAPDGFPPGALALIDATLPAFALAFKAMMAIDTTRTLIGTYLGETPAERILRGEIERGQVKAVRKVLWFSDLVGFTRIADSLPRDQLLELLNAYADCLVGVVHGHDGEVLKFMGDGILAVINGPDGHACRRALDAALAAEAAIGRLNRARAAAGLPVTGFTLALHEGEVLYGNVGSRERLDFTVVGPSVNEVSRIQAMSRSLDQPILVSARFAQACGVERGRLVSLGRYALRGVGQPQELFTLDPARPTTAH